MLLLLFLAYSGSSMCPLTLYPFQGVIWWLLRLIKSIVTFCLLIESLLLSNQFTAQHNKITLHMLGFYINWVGFWCYWAGFYFSPNTTAHLQHSFLFMHQAGLNVVNIYWAFTICITSSLPVQPAFSFLCFAVFA